MSELRTNFTNQIAWRCMNCIQRPKVVEKVCFTKKTEMSYDEKCAKISAMRGMLPNVEGELKCYQLPSCASDNPKDWETRSSRNHINDCWDHNAGLAEDVRYPDCIQESLPRTMSCANFVLKERKADTEKYEDLVQYLIGRRYDTIPLERLIANLARISYPSYSKLFFGDIWDSGKHDKCVKYNHAYEGFEFGNRENHADQKRFNRHKFVVASMIRKMLLMYTGKRAKLREKYLMMLMAADKESMARSVFHYLSHKRDDSKKSKKPKDYTDITLPMGTKIAELFHEDYCNPEDLTKIKPDDIYDDHARCKIYDNPDLASDYADKMASAESIQDLADYHNE